MNFLKIFIPMTYTIKIQQSTLPRHPEMKYMKTFKFMMPQVGIINSTPRNTPTESDDTIIIIILKELQVNVQHITI